MKLVIVLLLAWSTTVAARTPIASKAPAIVAAEAAWTAAATAPRESAHDAWVATVVAFDKALTALPPTDPLRADVALAVVAAYRNIGIHDKASDDAFLRAVPIAIVASPADEPGLRFLRARILLDADRLDEAVAEFGEIVTRFPASEVGEYAANLILDTLNRQHKFDDLLAWVDRMRADPKLLAHRTDLATLLDRIHLMALQKRAEQFAAAGDVAGFLQCAQTYRALLLAHPKYDKADELLYNAGVCFARANQTRQATLAWQELIAKYPKSPLAAKARSQLNGKGG